MMLSVPPWPFTSEYPNSGFSLNSGNPFTTVDDYYESLNALQTYSPPDYSDSGLLLEPDHHNGAEFPVDAHSCDQFRMFEFKVRKCSRGKSHDWTDCPFAHPGEKARRRDPKKFHYSASPCPEYRKGGCSRADSCEFAHGVFECWLHPARYRTQPCKDGMNCRRRVCFFAHSHDQLRVTSPRAEMFTSLAESPPMSPMMANSVNDILLSLCQLQLNKVKSMSSSWGAAGGSPPPMLMARPGFMSLPTTPTRVGFVDPFDEEEPVMERVESGRALRARMFQKLSKDNPLDRVDPDPEVDWVSELVQ